MTNGQLKPWVKVMIGAIATIITVGIAYGTLITEVGHNTYAIESNGDKIDKIDERLRNEEIKSGNIETDIEWIRHTLEMEYRQE